MSAHRARPSRRRPPTRRIYLVGNAPVGCHLADQLILPMALAAGGRYVTSPLSAHTRTNIETMCRFLEIGIKVVEGPHDHAGIEIQTTTSLTGLHGATLRGRCE